jgi:hypothetical protein
MAIASTNTVTPIAINRRGAGAVVSQTYASNLASQIATDLISQTSPPSTSGVVNAPSAAPAAPVSTAATVVDNPFMDWLGLSSTPSTPLIAGVPNWVLLAGAGLLLLTLSEKRS